jgi:hypothetical protein
MACINLTRHWKFRRLARLLDSPALARGTLELLWESAYEAVSDYVGAPDEIAEAVSWPDDPCDLVALLLDTGWLDQRAPGTYVIHDLWHHAPKYVRLRWTRAHPNTTPPWQLVHPCHDHGSAVPVSGTSHPIPSHPIERTAAAPRSHPVENPVDAVEHAGPPNIRVLLRLSYELDGQTFETLADFKEALKCEAARLGLPYDATSIAAVCDLRQHSRRPLMCSLEPAARRRAGGSR